MGGKESKLTCISYEDAVKRGKFSLDIIFLLSVIPTYILLLTHLVGSSPNLSAGRKGKGKKL